MTCPNCGAPVADNRRFCGKCGAALAVAAPPADPAPPPPAPMSATSLPTSPSSSWGGANASPPPAPPPAAPASDPDPFAPPDLTAQGGYGGPAPQYPPPGYPGAPGSWPGAGYGYAPPHTSGLAVTSLVLGLIGWVLCGVGSVLAVVLGFVARDQIKRSWGRLTGAGMATAGIILGFIGAAFWILIVIASLVSNANS